MKTLNLFTAGAIASTLFLSSCGGTGSDASTTQADSTTIADGHYTIDPSKSQVIWKGVMINVKEHFGKVNIQQGSIDVKDGKIAGGTVVIDMTSIAPQDTNYVAGTNYSMDKFLGHIRSNDFFNIEQFPTASFTLTSVEGSTGKGSLTVRDKTDTETIESLMVNKTADGIAVGGVLKFDRQKYGVAFSTGSPDFLIIDEITLSFEVNGRK